MKPGRRDRPLRRVSFAVRTMLPPRTIRDGTAEMTQTDDAIAPRLAQKQTPCPPAAYKDTDIVLQPGWARA